jgi:hypothetical protein
MKTKAMTDSALDGTGETEKYEIRAVAREVRKRDKRSSERYCEREREMSDLAGGIAAQEES